ncbi:MAG TPA: hypothetical protein VNK52_11455 [Hyphomicrobiaceae bacterium]|nr:hypothetical protein [Hyphomicrobiaceae bacterium]
MCGDLDEEDRLGEELYARFLRTANALIARQRRAAAAGQGMDRHLYMDELFADTLERLMRDNEATEPEDRYARLASQPLVLARLTGLLAGHLALQEDPLRKVMEALLHGYAEAESVEPDHGHDHAHHRHGHGHDHHH